MYSPALGLTTSNLLPPGLHSVYKLDHRARARSLITLHVSVCIMVDYMVYNSNFKGDDLSSCLYT